MGIYWGAGLLMWRARIRTGASPAATATIATATVALLLVAGGCGSPSVDVGSSASPDTGATNTGTTSPTDDTALFRGLLASEGFTAKVTFDPDQFDGTVTYTGPSTWKVDDRAAGTTYYVDSKEVVLRDGQWLAMPSLGEWAPFEYELRVAAGLLEDPALEVVSVSGDLTDGVTLTLRYGPGTETWEITGIGTTPPVSIPPTTTPDVDVCRDTTGCGVVTLVP